MPPKRKSPAGTGAAAAKVPPARSAPSRSAKTRAAAKTAAMYDDPFPDKLPLDDDIFDSSADELTDEDEKEEEGAHSEDVDSDTVERTPSPPPASRKGKGGRAGAGGRQKATTREAGAAAVTKKSKAQSTVEKSTKKTKVVHEASTPTTTLRQAGTLRFATSVSVSSSSAVSNLGTTPLATKASATKPSPVLPSLSTAISESPPTSEQEDADHWIRKYEPRDISEVAVHTGKIKDVREWLEKHTLYDHQSEKGGSILLLTGPAGSGKTTVLRILAKELGIEIVEWVNAINPNTLIQRPKVSGDNSRPLYTRAQTVDEEYVPVMEAFQSFFARASRFDPLTLESGGNGNDGNPSVFLSHPRKKRTRKNIMLLEDFPPISAHTSRQIFQDTISRFTRTERTSSVLVLIISDVFSKHNTQMLFSSMDYQEPALTARTMLPKQLMDYSPNCQEIKFNPIARTIMMKAIKRIVKEEFKAPAARNHRPSDEELELFYSLHNGDIRAMLNSLQFHCILPLKKRRQQVDESEFSDTSERDSSLGLFHAAGKVLYNKRNWHSFEPNSDMRLPMNQLHMSRPPMPFNPELELIDKLPVEPDLFGLMLHQNYPHHQTNIHGCSLAIDYLSISDLFSQRAGLENIHMTPYSTSIAIRGILFAPDGPGRIPQDRKQWWPELLGVNRSKREMEQMYNDFAACLVGETAEGFATGFINGPGTIPKSLIRHEIAPLLSIMYKYNPYHSFFRRFPQGKKQFLKSEVGVYGQGKGIQKRKVGEHETGLEDQVAEAAAVSSLTEVRGGGEGGEGVSPSTIGPLNDNTSSRNISSIGTFSSRSTAMPLQTARFQFTSTMVIGEEDPIEDFSD